MVEAEGGMITFNLFRRAGSSASVARERLQVLLSHERTMGSGPDLLAILYEEILATITKQVAVEAKNVRVRFDRRAAVSRLEINVDIPTQSSLPLHFHSFQQRPRSFRAISSRAPKTSRCSSYHPRHSQASCVACT